MCERAGSKAAGGNRGARVPRLQHGRWTSNPRVVEHNERDALAMGKSTDAPDILIKMCFCKHAIG